MLFLLAIQWQGYAGCIGDKTPGEFEKRQKFILKE